MSTDEVRVPEDLLVDVARRYYVDRQNKVEIGRALGLSRFKVARLLDEAVDRGAVRITLHRPGAPGNELARRVREAYHLQHVVVVEPPTRSPADLRQTLGRAAARLLEEILSDGDVLGVSWGRTIKAVAEAATRLPRCRVVQLTGIAGTPGENSVEIVRVLSALTGEPVHPLYTPLVVPDAVTADSLRASTDIRTTFERFTDVSVAMVAVGSWDPPNTQLRMFCTEEERAELDRRGARAEVCGSLLDAEGTVLDTSLTPRTMAVSPAVLRTVPTVLAVAGHPTKAEAVRSVLRGGLATALVTDAAVARALVRASGALT